MATVAEAGTVNSLLLSLKATTDPARAGRFMVTVQRVEPLAERVAEAQLRLDGTAGDCRSSGKFREMPGNAALIVTVASAATERALMEKAADDLLAATRTDPGTESTAPLAVFKTTLVPLARAGLLRVTVQVACPAEVSAVGLQVKPVREGVVVRFRETLTGTPLTVAWIVAVLSAATVETATEKVTEVELVATVAVAGTLSNGLSSESVTSAPPPGAARFRVTVQLVEVLDVKVE